MEFPGRIDVGRVVEFDPVIVRFAADFRPDGVVMHEQERTPQTLSSESRPVVAATAAFHNFVAWPDRPGVRTDRWRRVLLPNAALHVVRVKGASRICTDKAREDRYFIAEKIDSD